MAIDANQCSAERVVIVKIFSNDIQAIAHSHPVLCYGYPFNLLC